MTYGAWSGDRNVSRETVPDYEDEATGRERGEW
jgi:hypothetical protein